MSNRENYWQRRLAAFQPYLQYRHFLEIPLHRLAKAGFTYYIIDVDNTLVLRKNAILGKEIFEFLSALKKERIINDVCLVSNVTIKSSRRVERIRNIAKQLDCHYVCAGWPRNKPHGDPFQHALQKMSATPSKTMVIGDQLLTDVWGANRLGIKAILVDPLGKDHILTAAKRQFEKMIKRFFKYT